MLSRKQQCTADLLPQTQSQYTSHLYHTSLFSDCTIRSNSRIWHLHRCILAPRCEFFYTCFSSDFEEAQNASVDMDDDEPEILGRMLKWLYTLELVDSDGGWASDLQLWLMADKYGLSGLMDDCRTAIIKRSRSCAKDDQRFVDEADDFVEGMELLFVDLPDRDDARSMKEDVVEIMASMMARKMRELPVMEDLMRDVPGFGRLLIETLSRKGEQRRRASSSSLGSASVGSGVSSGGLGWKSPQAGKPHIPLNEDSEDEFD